MHTPDAKQAAEIRSPRGLYALLDDFTERVDTDLSNNAGMLGVPSPPQSFGLYRDGSRVAALPKPGAAGAEYAPAELDALPYKLVPNGRVLLAGASGGFAISARRSHWGRPMSLRSSPTRSCSTPSLTASARPPPLATDPRVHLSAASPLAITGRYDLVDLSGDFLDAGEANATSFSEEAIEGYLRALQPGGVISIPVSIREFPVYAVRVLATVRDASRSPPALPTRRARWSSTAPPGTSASLSQNRPGPPSRSPWSAASATTAPSTCPTTPGIDLAAARANIYNDLPPIDFENGEVESSGSAQDAVADEAELVLRGQTSPSQQAFDLRPITLDRPFYYAILRLDRLPQILSRLEILPQQEVGQLVNVAVLAQSAVLALLVLAVPLFAPRVAQGR